MARGSGSRGWLAGVLAAGIALAACDPWRCDFESHGACIEFTTDPPDMDDARTRVDRLLELTLPYWNLRGLSGWRIEFRDSAQYACYFQTRNDGCTDYLEKTMSVRVPPTAPGCFEASELLHELGHYALGDPMHSNALWEGVDAQFAAVVWEREDAPRVCVERFEGIQGGVWTVRSDRF